MDAFHTLIQNHILSAPVWDGDAYQGFLDVKDLVAAVVFTLNLSAKRGPGDQDTFLESAFSTAPPNVSSLFAAGQEGVRLGDMGGLFSAGDVNIKRGDSVRHLTTRYLCKRHPFRPVTTSDPLSRAIVLLTQRDVHRVPVTEDGQLVGVLSQSAVMSFLSLQLGTAGFLGSPTGAFFSQRAARSRKDLVCGHVGASALSVFTLMYQTGTSGLPLVDNYGALVGQISASDMKLFLLNPSPSLLALPVMDFLSAVRQTQLHTRAPLVTVGPEATVAQVVRKMTVTGLHRVYVADKDRRPLGVISMGDVLRQLVEHRPQLFA
jgi:CBS domain-containing protein